MMQFGFGGLLTLDLTHKKANRFMRKMQDAGVGYLAVSLGYFKTLFSCSAQHFVGGAP
jgi:methionine-gamma-lyase